MVSGTVWMAGYIPKALDRQRGCSATGGGDQPRAWWPTLCGLTRSHQFSSPKGYSEIKANAELQRDVLDELLSDASISATNVQVAAHDRDAHRAGVCTNCSVTERDRLIDDLQIADAAMGRF